MTGTLGILLFAFLHHAYAGDWVVVGDYGFPAESVEIQEEQYEIEPGNGNVGTSYPPEDTKERLAWGDSYAYSDEIFLVRYVGHAYAAGNVYQGKRIIRVCFWWTGPQGTSAETCSDARYSQGRWNPDWRESTASYNDSLGWNPPKTIFHIKTTRIAPNQVVRSADGSDL